MNETATNPTLVEPQAEAVMTRRAARQGGDGAGANVARVMWLPGFRNTTPGRRSRHHVSVTGHRYAIRDARGQTPAVLVARLAERRKGKPRGGPR